MGPVVNATPSFSSATKMVDVVLVAVAIWLLGDAAAFAFENFIWGAGPILALLLNGLLAVAGMWASWRHDEVLRYISFFFCYVFFAISPLYQLGGNVDPIFYEEYVLWTACLCTILFSVIGIMTLWPARQGRCRWKSVGVRTRPRYLLLGFAIVLAAAVFMSLFASVLFTSRRTFSMALNTLADPASAAFIANVLMSFPLYGATIGLHLAYRMRDPVPLGAYLLLFGISLLINNVWIVPRFKLAGVIIFILCYLKRSEVCRYIVIISFVGMAVSPFFHVFRTQFVTVEVQAFEGLAEFFSAMDYDAFQMLCYTIQAVLRSGYSWGTNLLGALLFFVPRAIWEAKPVPSSFEIVFIVRSFRFSGTENLSNPLVSEGYYAFGYGGVLAVSYLFWKVVNFLERKRRELADSVLTIVYCVSAGMILLFLRGTLMVGVAYTMAAIVSAVVPYYLLGGRTGEKLSTHVPSAMAEEKRIHM